MIRRRNSSICIGMLFVIMVSLGISDHQYVEASAGKSDVNIRILEQPKQEIKKPREIPRNDIRLPVTGDANNSVFSYIIGGILILFSFIFLVKMGNKRMEEVN
ncbi:LPXTG cell wall anchor domain-containing protein [Paenilisteria rocourtiae]|uniref:LPXTG-motif cell wall-anchored protein n=1 Tax=Listeria rocourtiae TaxID=647910 RepID=A0A4R6ZS93_9LIST|nr:LPXTG cell wall anchor domain-containing protein [Listeria rocourtiae]EUJ49208.1 hypothetical protein PROCOU_04866 [Listeria rocourtiae FSL F6-920]MBC1434604.1 LPXTG cell wall anchor domain-containing protein [Listeria rocourtiae]MBC1603296.1 LPXTG cell wall anchor domain-containing protein [Listeria rocourtiae]TDR55418.1 LPXTG-motif cell wall-anchored protein [Listeria rocourtiae]